MIASQLKITGTVDDVRTSFISSLRKMEKEIVYVGVWSFNDKGPKGDMANRGCGKFRSKV